MWNGTDSLRDKCSILGAFPRLFSASAYDNNVIRGEEKIKKVKKD